MPCDVNAEFYDKDPQWRTAHSLALFYVAGISGFTDLRIFGYVWGKSEVLGGFHSNQLFEIYTSLSLFGLSFIMFGPEFWHCQAFRAARESEVSAAGEMSQFQTWKHTHWHSHSLHLSLCCWKLMSQWTLPLLLTSLPGSKSSHMTAFDSTGWILI